MRRKAALLALVSGLILASGVSAALAEGGGSQAQIEAAGRKSAAKKSAKTDHVSKKDATHVISTSDSYVGIDPIYTTIFSGDQIVGTLMLGIGLEVPDENLRSKIEERLPVLRDLYVRTMVIYAMTSVRPWRQPDAEGIASVLQTATDRKLKSKGARVLLAQLAIRLNK